MPDIAHALVLTLHQPPGNLEELLLRNEWEAREILCALDRIPALMGRRGSGPSGIWRCPALCWKLSPARIFKAGSVRLSIAARSCGITKYSLVPYPGNGYYHPVLPLIPGWIGKSNCTVAGDRPAFVQPRWVFRFLAAGDGFLPWS